MQLDADSQLFGMLFKVIQGMTGTLWNVQTFTKLIQAIFPSTTASQVIDILSNKRTDAVSEINLTEIDFKDQQKAVKQLVGQIYGREGVPKGSLLDAAGMFNDIEDRSLIGKELMSPRWWKDSPLQRLWLLR